MELFLTTSISLTAFSLSSIIINSKLVNTNLVERIHITSTYFSGLNESLLF